MTYSRWLDHKSPFQVTSPAQSDCRSGLEEHREESQEMTEGLTKMIMEEALEEGLPFPPEAPAAEARKVVDQVAPARGKVGAGVNLLLARDLAGEIKYQIDRLALRKIGFRSRSFAVQATSQSRQHFLRTGIEVLYRLIGGWARNYRNNFLASGSPKR